MRFSQLLQAFLRKTISPSTVGENYTKKEVHIKMRDGATLFTAIYTPKDHSKKYPIIMQRTPYSCAPYGETEFKKALVPAKP